MVDFSLPPSSYRWQLKGSKERLDVVQKNTLSTLSVTYSARGVGNFGGGVNSNVEGKLITGRSGGAGKYRLYGDGGVLGDSFKYRYVARVIESLVYYLHYTVLAVSCQNERNSPVLTQVAGSGDGG